MFTSRLTHSLLPLLQMGYSNRVVDLAIHMSKSA